MGEERREEGRRRREGGVEEEEDGREGRRKRRGERKRRKGYLWVMVINEVKIDAMFSHNDKCLSKLKLIQFLPHFCQYKGPGVDSFQVAPRHLKD